MEKLSNWDITIFIIVGVFLVLYALCIILHYIFSAFAEDSRNNKKRNENILLYKIFSNLSKDPKYYNTTVMVKHYDGDRKEELESEAQVICRMVDTNHYCNEVGEPEFELVKNINNLTRYTFIVNMRNVTCITKMYDDGEPKYFINFNLFYLNQKQDFIKMIEVIHEKKENEFELLYEEAKNNKHNSFLA